MLSLDHENGSGCGPRVEIMSSAVQLVSEVVTDNTYTEFCSSLCPYHDVYSKDLLSSLVASMEVDGWVGSPLVQYGGQLMTGSHRYFAARKVGINLQVVDLCDVFGIEPSEIDELIEHSDNWVVEATYLAIADNADLAKELGMDAH